MPTTKTIELFQYSELSESAKQTARDWWFSCRDETDYESVIEDFKHIAEILGIDFKTHSVKLVSGKTRYDPNIWYSLGYCQGDYAAFEGTIRYRKGMAKAMRSYASQDEALHAIADDLAALFKRSLYRDVFVVTYSDYYGAQVEPSEYDWSDGAADRSNEARDIVKRLNSWLYDTLRKEDEYLSEEEQIADAMAANEYTFRADGRRED